MEKSGNIQFKDPYEMLTVIDDDILEGRISLHKWQREILEDYGKPSSASKPYKAAVRAANGSGKDQFVIAPCALWTCMVSANAVAIVTTASGNQLDRQTDKYIKQLMNTINKMFGTQVWKMNYRHYTNLLNGSTIELFVTDEAGRAEGWHPVVPGGELAIFVSEAKSVPDEIFTALARCTGFTKRVDVSSPGPPSGHFYNMCTGGNWNQYHVTAFDCPHLSEEYINEIKDSYGETSALYKSMIMAEFGGMDEQVVINHQKLVDLDKHEIEHLEEDYNVAGLDLSAGGDEQVLVIRNGNKTLAVEAFNFRDTVALINHLEHLFRKYKLDHEQSVIYGDAGGLGKPILDQLKANWNIVYVLNQAKPYNNLAYLNRGAELWFSVGKLIEYGEIMVPRESKLRKQLASRYFVVTPQNKLQLESKKQARSKGHVSPDRADAFVLAFADYRGIKPKKLRKKRTEKFTPKQFNLTSNKQRAVFGFSIKPNPWLQDEIQQLQELSRSRN
jgi:phage terminase large subunit